MSRVLRPTLRNKNRYVKYQPPGYNNIETAYKELFGIVGLAQSGLKLVLETEDYGILKVSRNKLDNIRAAILWSNKKSILASGTIKKIMEG